VYRRGAIDDARPTMLTLMQRFLWRNRAIDIAYVSGAMNSVPSQRHCRSRSAAASNWWWAADYRD
jgi:hypothetical protein